MKLLRWIWFAFGSVGCVDTCVHSWQRLGKIDAFLVTCVMVSFGLDWFVKTAGFCTSKAEGDR